MTHWVVFHCFISSSKVRLPASWLRANFCHHYLLNLFLYGIMKLIEFQFTQPVPVRNNEIDRISNEFLRCDFLEIAPHSILHPIASNIPCICTRLNSIDMLWEWTAWKLVLVQNGTTHLHLHYEPSFPDLYEYLPVLVRNNRIFGISDEFLRFDSLEIAPHSILQPIASNISFSAVRARFGWELCC